MRLYLATGNKGKIVELQALVAEFMPQFTEVIGRAARNAEETEETFQGNALIKVDASCAELRAEGEKFFAILSDDSGLEVDALGGRPGVHSARYAGPTATSEDNIKKLLAEMVSIEQREARFVCSLYLRVADPSLEQDYSALGECRGLIMREAKGSGGFGYDPVFWSEELKKLMSEASLEEKNQISHRRRAFEDLVSLVRK